MVFRYSYPLDPRCPEVVNFMQSADDPYMKMSGCWDEFLEDFKKKHRADCDRCAMHGADHVEVVD